MKKNKLIIPIVVLSLVCIVAIIVALKNKTPYSLCKIEISLGPENTVFYERENKTLYEWALENIGKYRSLYFGGIITAIISGIADVSCIIGSVLKKKETVIDNSITNSLD